MKDFFKVKDLHKALEYASDFTSVDCEQVHLTDSFGRIAAADIFSAENIPDFSRSTMDGYAVAAASSFGATEAGPAYLTVKGTVKMGVQPECKIKTGEAARISTGGMLPEGTDSVVMIEHVQTLDDKTIEVYKSVAPGSNIIEAGEDVGKAEIILSCGQKIRAQEAGMLAAAGVKNILVYKKPVIGIISTGDEVIEVNGKPGPAQIRDINTYTLSSLVLKAGGTPLLFGIVRDSFDELLKACLTALNKTDMLIISGGSSVGVRDFTIDVFSGLPDSTVLFHGISISPGKPTILAKSNNKALWGLPGHAVSAMIVFEIVVKPFVERMGGYVKKRGVEPLFTAILTRNIASSQGRTDFVRGKLIKKDKILYVEPVLGKSGLISNMVKADVLVKIGKNSEGIEKGVKVKILPI